VTWILHPARRQTPPGGLTAPERPAATAAWIIETRQIRRIGVIGAGTMGNGIAQASAILLQNTRAAGRPKDLADVTTLESASEE
jgi:hypothetical protein